MARNHYETLQVFPNAGAQEVKDAFRFLLFRYHPDHNRGKEEWAVQKTMELVEAYHVLSDPARRAHHDVMRTVKLREDAPVKKGLFSKGPDEKTKQAEAACRDASEKFKADEFEQAILAFRKAADLDPEYPNVRFNMGVCFLALERLNDALAWIQDHVNRKKDDQDARALHQKVFTLSQKMKAARPGA